MFAIFCVYYHSTEAAATAATVTAMEQSAQQQAQSQSQAQQPVVALTFDHLAQATRILEKHRQTLGLLRWLLLLFAAGRELIHPTPSFIM